MVEVLTTEEGSCRGAEAGMEHDVEGRGRGNVLVCKSQCGRCEARWEEKHWVTRRDEVKEGGWKLCI